MARNSGQRANIKKQFTNPTYGTSEPSGGLFTSGWDFEDTIDYDEWNWMLMSDTKLHEQVNTDVFQYTVDYTSGTDAFSAAGTSGDPFKTIPYALEQIPCGKQGEITLSIEDHPITSDSTMFSNSVVFTSAGTATITFKHPAASNFYYGIVVEGGACIDFDSIPVNMEDQITAAISSDIGLITCTEGVNVVRVNSTVELNNVTSTTTDVPSFIRIEQGTTKLEIGSSATINNNAKTYIMNMLTALSVGEIYEMTGATIDNTAYYADGVTRQHVKETVAYVPVTTATGGTFKLKFRDKTIETGAIAWNASGATITTEIESALGSDTVHAVTTTKPGGSAITSLSVTFASLIYEPYCASSSLTAASSIATYITKRQNILPPVNLKTNIEGINDNSVGYS